MKRHRKTVEFILFPVLLFSLISPLCAGNGLVADPFRAVYQTWETHPLAGKDFWLLLDPRWLSLKGLEKELFIQESGTGFVPIPMTGENIMSMLPARNRKPMFGSFRMKPTPWYRILRI